MEALLTGNAYQQVASVLLVLTRRFWKKRQSNEIIIDLPLTHRIIGTLAALSPRINQSGAGKADKSKIISQKDHLIVIKDLKKLEEKSQLVLLKKQFFNPYILKC